MNSAATLGVEKPIAHYMQCQHCGELTPQRLPMISSNSKPQSIPAGTVVSLPDGGEVMLMHATLVEAVETEGGKCA